MIWYIVWAIINILLFIWLFIFIKTKIKKYKWAFKVFVNIIVWIGLFFILGSISYVIWSYNIVLNQNKNIYNNINLTASTDERIKKIFDFKWMTNSKWATDFKKINTEFKASKTSMIALWEKSYDEFDKIQNISEKVFNKINVNEIDDIDKKLSLLITKSSLEYSPMKKLIKDIIELLKETTEINKDFYQKLYNIQINDYDESFLNMTNYIKPYITEKQYQALMNNFSIMRKKYIETTTNKNMLDKFNN